MIKIFLLVSIYKTLMQLAETESVKKYCQFYFYGIRIQIKEKRLMWTTVVGLAPPPPS